MIKLCVPFLLGDLEQIPVSIIRKRGFGLEANVFDAKNLSQLIGSGDLAKALKNAGQIGSIKSFHYPTESADYLRSKKLTREIFATIKILSQLKIEKLVIHTNHIQPKEQFDPNKLNQTRREYVDFLSKLAEYAKPRKVKICVENLPIIGNEGDDFDSIFVFPEDFKKLKNTNLKIAWDLGHWAYTCSVYKSVSRVYESSRKTAPKFPDFLNLDKQIEHFHFSSFKQKPKLACEEGVIPQAGDYSIKAFRQACRFIHQLPGEYDMTLEIKEKNYHSRKNLIRTIEWFDDNVF